MGDVADSISSVQHKTRSTGAGTGVGSRTGNLVFSGSFPDSKEELNGTRWLSICERLDACGFAVRIRKKTNCKISEVPIQFDIIGCAKIQRRIQFDNAAGDRHINHNSDQPNGISPVSSIRYCVSLAPPSSDPEDSPTVCGPIPLFK